MNAKSSWQPLNMENKAFVEQPVPGKLFLGLAQVPPSWPYTFQWSGLSQNLSLDVAHYPVLIAKVDQVHGYAHMDIDVLDSAGHATRTLRSSTLNAPGLSEIDLGKELEPAVYRLQFRIIVGGENSGCSATYDWVRVVNREDAALLRAHPEYSRIMDAQLKGWIR